MPEISLPRHEAQDILAAAKAALALPPPNTREIIHGFRVAMKRWRALLRLLEPVVGSAATELRREAAALAHRLGASRDVQAALDALNDCRSAAHQSPAQASSALAPQSWNAMIHRLETSRAAHEAEAIDEALLRSLLAALARAETAIADWPLDASHFEDMASAIARHYRRAAKAMPQDWRAEDPAALHEFRKRVIVLRYQMNMLMPLWPKMWRVYISDLQKLRTHMGQFNDLEILRHSTQTGQLLARWHTRLAPLINERQDDHLREAEIIARRIFASDAKTIEATIKAQFMALAAPDANKEAEGAADAG